MHCHRDLVWSPDKKILCVSHHAHTLCWAFKLIGNLPFTGTQVNDNSQHFWFLIRGLFLHTTCGVLEFRFPDGHPRLLIIKFLQVVVGPFFFCNYDNLQYKRQNENRKRVAVGLHQISNKIIMFINLWLKITKNMQFSIKSWQKEAMKDFNVQA